MLKSRASVPNRLTIAERRPTKVRIVGHSTLFDEIGVAGGADRAVQLRTSDQNAWSRVLTAAGRCNATRSVSPLPSPMP